MNAKEARAAITKAEEATIYLRVSVSGQVSFLRIDKQQARGLVGTRLSQAVHAYFDEDGYFIIYADDPSLPAPVEAAP